MLKRLSPVLIAGLVLTIGSSYAMAEETAAPLMPDPNSPDTYFQAVWVLIIFVILLAILYPTAWKNVLAGLKAREARIRGDIIDAEETRAKAEATLKEYAAQLATAGDKVRDMLAQAAKDAEGLAGIMKLRAQQEAEEIKERAMQEIETARTAAVADIYQQAASLSTSIAEKILRRNLNVDDQRDLVNQSIEQFSKVGKN
jgi:F-type H+-transporting ATPase subunit b